MISPLFFTVLLLTIGSASLQHTASLAHLPGCGCKTTTTCSPEVGASSCPYASARPGKRGPKGLSGPKGDKGAPSESNENITTQLQNRIVQLSDDLNVFSELSYSFPSACSQYIKHEAKHRKFGLVPLYPKHVTGNMAPIIANCTRVEDIHGPRGRASIDVPFNSMYGRTLIVKATPREKPGHDASRFTVDFRGDGSLIFHVSVRFNLAGSGPTNLVVRNDHRDSSWNVHELDLLTDFPFRIGIPFTMKITADEVGYHCFVDGKQIFVFKHRQPMSEIASIAIFGDLTIGLMSFN